MRFLKLFVYVKKYKWNILGNILSNILMVVFAIISLPLLTPFLQILFGQQTLVTTKPAWEWNTSAVSQYFNYYMSQIVLQQGESVAMAYVCGLIVITYFFKNLFRYLSLFFMAPVRNGIVKDIRQQLFEKTMHLRVAYFSDTRKGDLISRITADVQEIEWSILSILETLFRDPLMLAGALGLMIFISPRMTLFVLVLILFTALVIGGIGRVLRRQSGVVQETLGKLISTLEESLFGIRIIKAFGAEHYQQQKFESTNETYKKKLTRLLWRRDLSSPMSEFLGVSIVALLIWFGFNEVKAGNLTSPVFFTFLLAFYSVMEPVKRFSNAFYSIQKGMAAVDRVDVILDAPEEIMDAPDALPIHSFEHQIEYRNVHFIYNEAEEPAVKNINLIIPKGKALALVGNSGAGKSTLADLLPRFYDVTKGSILIDGIDVKTLKIKDLRSLISIVSQDAVLFNDTIFNNIVFGMEGVTEEAVINAAKVANAHDFIMETEKGYQTNIGDRGMKLSGGQRQRLTIARAVLRNTPILILDEATSALDSESEQLVQEALLRIMQHRTTIVIAHRLSTIQYAHEIAVLKKGEIIERGSHQELLSMGGEYQKLVALQVL